MSQEQPLHAPFGASWGLACTCQLEWHTEYSPGLWPHKCWRWASLQVLLSRGMTAAKVLAPAEFLLCLPCKALLLLWYMAPNGSLKFEYAQLICFGELTFLLCSFSLCLPIRCPNCGKLAVGLPYRQFSSLSSTPSLPYSLSPLETSSPSSRILYCQLNGISQWHCLPRAHSLIHSIHWLPSAHLLARFCQWSSLAASPFHSLIVHWELLYI